MRASKLYPTFFASVVILFLIPLLATSFEDSKLGVMVPMYMRPGYEWDNVIKAKNSHPDIPVLAIVNPHNGPGTFENTSFTKGIQKMQLANVLVLGYVHTDYANRNSSEVIDEIDRYYDWYNVNGLFFDQMSNVAGNENYYHSLSDYAKSKGFSITVGNTGNDTLPSYIGTVDTIVIYENQGLPNVEFLKGWHKNYDKKNFAVISYGVSIPNNLFIKDISDSVGYVYMTNDVMPNPWDSLPVYFRGFVAQVGHQ